MTWKLKHSHVFLFFAVWILISKIISSIIFMDSKIPTDDEPVLWPHEQGAQFMEELCDSGQREMCKALGREVK